MSIETFAPLTLITWQEKIWIGKYSVYIQSDSKALEVMIGTIAALERFANLNLKNKQNSNELDKIRVFPFDESFK